MKIRERFDALMLRKTWLSNDMYVRQPHRARPLVLLILVAMMGLGWGATVIITVMDPGPLRACASGVIGVYIALASMSVFKRMNAYRFGWFDGRSQMIRSLVETQKRGLSMDDWLRGEAERDAAIFGLPPLPPPDGRPQDD